MKEGFTKKLYWGKWSHKATIMLGRVNGDDHKTEMAYRKELRAIKAFVKAQDQEFKSLETYQFLPTRHSSYYALHRYDQFITLYFKDQTVIDLLLNDSHWKDKITYIEKPHSKAHLEALEVDKMVVRKSLWFERFRYCARLKSYSRSWNYSTGGYDEPDLKQQVMTWLDDQLVKNQSRVDGQDFKITSTGYYSHSLHIYFAHASDAMLFRLSFSQNIKASERIKLMSELGEPE